MTAVDYKAGTESLCTIKHFIIGNNHYLTCHVQKGYWLIIYLFIFYHCDPEHPVQAEMLPTLASPARCAP